MNRGVSPCFYPHKEIIEDWYNFFLKSLVEFSSEHTCAWYFVFWMIIDSISLISIGIFRVSVFSCEFWQMCLSRNWSILMWVIKLMGIGLSTVFPYYPFNVHVICSYVSSFIVICIIFHFFLGILHRVSLVLLIF